MLRRFGFVVLPALVILGFSASTLKAQNVLTQHTREVTRTGTAPFLSRLSANQELQLDIVLPLSDRAGLQSFLKELYNPDTPSYRQFLTPQQFTARFGPSQDEYDAVLHFAQSNGLKVIGGSRDGLDVQVRGTVSAIESAFHVTLNSYRHPSEDRTFFAPDREPTTNLPFALWHVSGLDTYSNPHTMLINRNDYAAAHGVSPEEFRAHSTGGSGPSASYLGSDMRAAYYGGTSLTGAGQNLGLFEFVGTDLADLTTYYENVGQTNSVPITLLSVDGTSTSCLASNDCDDTEQTLDMTQALGMAPGLNSLVVYIGSSDTAILSAMTTHSPLPLTIGCSWGWTPVDPTALDPFFEKMAAQGQNFFAASGDTSTWNSTDYPWPAEDANVVSVGGTVLVTASAAGPWASETSWSDSGGGISPDSIAIPSWQQLPGVINSTNQGSATLRNGPDVAANADFSFYTCSDQTDCIANYYGGTSFAAPMWAAYISLVNQQLASQSKPSIGFINPTIYSQNITSAYATDFHDIISGTSGSYSANTGFDLVTGWGSPNGVGLINALAPLTVLTPAFTLSTSAPTITLLSGGSGSSTITTAVSGGFSSSVNLSVSGLPSGVTASFSPSSIAAPGAGTSTLNFVVKTGTAVGSYPVTITATGGGITHTATITVQITGSFSISISPNAGALPPSHTGYTIVTVKGTSGFDAPVQFSATGLPPSITGSFNPTSIVGPGSSRFNLAIAKGAPLGTYNITILATSGGVVKTATLVFSVN